MSSNTNNPRKGLRLLEMEELEKTLGGDGGGEGCGDCPDNEMPGEGGEDGSKYCEAKKEGGQYQGYDASGKKLDCIGTMLKTYDCLRKDYRCTDVVFIH